jgi:hypothetical protein
MSLCGRAAVNLLRRLLRQMHYSASRLLVSDSATAEACRAR